MFLLPSPSRQPNILETKIQDGGQNGGSLTRVQLNLLKIISTEWTVIISVSLHVYMTFSPSLVIRIVPDEGPAVDWTVPHEIQFRDVLVCKLSCHCFRSNFIAKKCFYGKELESLSLYLLIYNVKSLIYLGL